MMRESYGRRSQDPPLLETVEIVVALILMAACWFIWYVGRERFYLENRGKPWYWPDRVRVMQAIVLGMTRSAKPRY